MEYQNLRYRVVSLLTLICALFSCGAVFAQTQDADADFYLQIPTIESTDPVQVDIMLDNPNTPVVGYSFTIALPKGLSIVSGSEQTTDRFSGQQTLQYANNKFLAVSMDNNPFTGTSGSVGSFKVQATPEFVQAEAETKIVLSKIALAGLPQADGRPLQVSVGSTTKEFTVKVAEQDPVIVTVSGPAAAVVATPGQTALVTIAMNNNKILNAMQFDVVLPDGFTFDQSGFQKSERLSSTAMIQSKNNDGYTRVMIYDMSTNQILTAGEGNILSFSVNVPEDFDADDATVLIKDVKATVNLKSVPVEGFSVTLNNSAKDYGRANEVVETLQQKLTDTLAQIAEQAADVKDKFTGEEISANITALKEAIDEAYNAGTLSANFADVVTTPAEGIDTAIDTLLSEALAAQAEFENNKKAVEEAINAANAAVEALENALNEANSTIAQDYADVADQFTGDSEAIQNDIDALKAVIAGATEGGTILDESIQTDIANRKQAIEDAIAKMKEDAKAAQAQFEQDAADAAAREAALANGNNIANGLQSKLETALATIADKCVDVKDNFKGEDIQAAIDNMKTALQEAYNNKTIVEDLDSITAPATSIEEQINALVAAATAAQEEFDKLGDDLKKAYQDAKAVVAGLQTKLDEALATIEKEYPDVKDTYKGEGIQAQITSLASSVEEEFNKRTLVANYESAVTNPAAVAEKAIADLLAAAKASQDAFNEGKNEEAAQIARELKHKVASELVAQLRAQLAEVQADIKENCADVAVNYSGATIAAQLDDMQDAIDNALADKQIIDKYEELVAPASSIEAEINKLREDAYAAQKAIDDAAAKLAENKAKAEKEISDLRTALSTALANVATNYPALAEQFNTIGEGITTRINTLESTVNDAVADKSLADDTTYDIIMTPVAEIAASIAKIEADAKEVADKNIADEYARQQAINNAKALIDNLNSELASALETISGYDASVREEYTGEEIRTAIDALAAAIEKADADGVSAAEVVELTASASTIDENISDLVAKAKAAQDKIDADKKAAQEALDAALAKANGVITDLNTKLSEVLGTIEKDCPDVAADFKGENIREQIALLNSVVYAAYDNGTLSTNYDDVMNTPVKNIEESIASLLAAAKDAQGKSDEARAEAIRNEAYSQGISLVDQLNALFNDAQTTITNECKDVAAQFKGESIKTAIANVKAALDKALADKTISTSEVATITASAPSIQADIVKLVEDAKAAQADFDANVALKAAKANADKAIAALDKALADALAEIKSSCPDVQHLFNGALISQQINVLRNAVNAANEDKTLAVNYDQVMAPVADIEAAIAAMIAEAKEDQQDINDANAALAYAYKNAIAEKAALEDKLAQTLETIAKECPDVASLFPGSDISRQISALNSAINSAYKDGSLVDNYADVVTATATSISEAIDALLADAKKAQAADDAEEAAKIARDNAYANGMALVDALNSQLADAVAGIAKDYPAVADLYKGEEIAAAIAAMKSNLDNAYKEGTIVENYDALTSSAPSIQTSIENLIASAAAAQKAFEEAAAALEANKEKAAAAIADLQKELDEALKTIAAECADVIADYNGADIQKQINALNAAVEAAIADKSLATKYDDVMAPAAGISEAIAKLVEDAKAAEAEFKAKQALETARTNANAKLAELDQALADALKEIAAKYPAVAHLYPGTAISQSITVLRNAVNAAYENKTLADKYDEVMAPAATIEAEIAKLISDAQAAQKDIDDAETARQKYNAEAYEADLAAIAELEEELAKAKIEMDENYKDYNYTEAYNKIKAAIDALKARADKEKERVAKSGTYSYSVDKLPVQQMIDKMLADAKASGVGSIFADQVEDGDRIYTLDGRQVPTLQHGKVNIIVKADGTRHKVFVK